jgi:RNA polymerase sigma-70 factor (ECF subfamily)
MEKNQKFEVDDYTLVEQLQAGNTQAFNSIITKYQRGIYGKLLGLCGDRDLASDLMQDTFIKAFVSIKNSDKYTNQPGTLGTWLHITAKNTYTDYYRKAKRKPVIMRIEGLITDDNLEIGQYQESYEDARIADELKQTLYRCIRQLPETQKELILFRIFSEMQYKDIASITDVSVNTSLGRMRYALRNLRKIIQETEHIKLHIA